MLANVMALRTLAAGMAWTAAGAATWPPSPCYTTINDVNSLLPDVSKIEGVCFSTIYASPSPELLVTFRAYPRGAAFLVEATIPDDPGNTFADNVFFTSSFVFDYLTGDNARKENLTDARTAPFVLRPVSPERGGDPTWVGAMALAPSLWPAGSSPPAPTLSNVNVRPFGEVVMASIPAVLSAAPTEDDFRSAYMQLEEAVSLVALPGQWVINTTSPLTPSFNFYFTEGYNGTSWQIEASAEVFYVPPTL